MLVELSNCNFASRSAFLKQFVNLVNEHPRDIHYLTRLDEVKRNVFGCVNKQSNIISDKEFLKKKNKCDVTGHVTLRFETFYELRLTASILTAGVICEKQI